MNTSDQLSRFSKPISITALFLFAAALFAFTFKIWFAPRANDFEVYYRIAERMGDGKWLEMYSLKDRDGILRYSPVVLPLFWPLKFFGFYEARLFWYALNWAAFAMSLWIIRGLLIQTFKLSLPKATFTIVLAFLLTLRVFSSSLIEGQVVAIMLLGLTAALKGFVKSTPQGPAAGLLVPNAMKVGFAVLYPLLWIRGTKYFLKVIGHTLLYFAAGLILLSMMNGSLVTTGKMFVGWIQMLFSVLDDNSEHYWLCAHYSSQALNSVLLRFWEWGWMKGETARSLWLASSFLGLSSLLWYWWRNRKTRDPLGLMLLFSLGVMAYLLFMPFTYRHTLTFAMLPVLALLIAPKNRFVNFALLFYFFFVSVASMDIVREKIFFFLQRASFPFMAMALITIALVRTFESRPRG